MYMNKIIKVKILKNLKSSEENVLNLFSDLIFIPLNIALSARVVKYTNCFSALANAE